MPASTLTARIGKLYSLRLGLIMGGVWIIANHSAEPACSPPQVNTVAPCQSVAVPTQCSHSIALYCRYMTTGDSAASEKDYALAEKSYRAALFETTLFNASSFCRMETLAALGQALMHQNKDGEALACFERAQQLCEHTLSANDIRATDSLLDLAISYQRNNKMAEAEKAFKQIDIMWQNAPAGWEENKAVSRHNLAAFYNCKSARLPHLSGTTNKFIDLLYPYQQFSFNKAGAVFK